MANHQQATPYKARATAYLILTSFVASVAGLSYGFSIGISGVTTMKSFQNSLFPNIVDYINEVYCSSKWPIITMFTSSLYLAGFIASFPASFVTKHYGRRPSIILGGLSSITGATLTGAAQNMAMLILGRIMLGVGAGFGNQAVLVYLSEMASPKLRGTLNIMFRLAVSLGILCACLVNYVMGVASEVGLYSGVWPSSWRLSLGLAGAPAILMTIGGMLLPETPHSLIERGYFQQGRSVLSNIRGTPEVEAEYEAIKEAGYRANSCREGPGFRMLFKHRQSRPQLLLAVIIPLFQQFSGGTGAVIHAFVPFIGLQVSGGSTGYGYRPAVLIAAGVNVFGTLFTITNVDRWGRRVFFLEAGFQMFFALVILALIKRGNLPYSDILMETILCVYVCGYAWSWGPLGWLLPSEIFPFETRSAGQAVAVASNMLFTLVIVLSFPTMLCKLGYGTFFFFAAWVFVMTAFVYWFLPETKRVPMEDMISEVWRKHWFWKRYYESSGSKNL